MLALSAIFQGFDQNILQDAVITATVVPQTTYDVTDLGFLRPDWRIRWSAGTLTITWTLASPALGDLFVLPMSNLDTAGSPSATITLTNASGLSVAITMPAIRRNGLPKTLVVDLTAAEANPTTRTSDVWHLVIVGNPSDVTLGAAAAIYSPLTQLGDRDFKWGYTIRKRGAQAEIQNAHLTRYQQDLLASERMLDLETLATDADADALEDWFEGGNGRARPGVLWLQHGNVDDAYLGILQDEFTRTVGTGECVDTNVIHLTFTELSKGIPLL